MWETIQLTATQWMAFYSRSVSSFFRNMTPDQYMLVTIVAFVLALGLMQMKFGR